MGRCRPRSGHHRWTATGVTSAAANSCWAGAVGSVRGLEMKSDVVVDADSHVEEPQETWQYLDEKYADRRPVPVTGDAACFKYGANSLWFIDGNVFPKMTA